MKAKRNIFFILCALFVFYTTSSSLQLSKKTNTSVALKVFTVSENDSDSEKDHSIASIKEYGGFVVKGNENTFSGFQILQNSKKHLSTNLALESTNFLCAFYSSYCHKRINSIHQNPFYISYHRLTI